VLEKVQIEAVVSFWIIGEENNVQQSWLGGGGKRKRSIVS
jgi:hypothetical protein